MYSNSNQQYGTQFNPNVLKDLKKINEKIREESKKDVPDKERILKLRQEQLMRGMELNTGYINNYRRNIPW